MVSDCTSAPQHVQTIYQATSEPAERSVLRPRPALIYLARNAIKSSFKANKRGAEWCPQMAAYNSPSILAVYTRCRPATDPNKILGVSRNVGRGAITAIQFEAKRSQLQKVCNELHRRNAVRSIRRALQRIARSSHTASRNTAWTCRAVQSSG